MDATAQRRELRRNLAERRSALSPPERMSAAQGLRRSLGQLPEYLTDARVAGYWASHGELPLNLVIPPLAARGQQFLLPVLGKHKHLRFAPWQSGDAVEPNRYGIPEPVEPAELFEPFQLDLVFVPLLGFDRRGHRLGQGGGYYDRSFAFLNEQVRPTEPLLVGIAYDFQELEIVNEESWDVALDFIATDRELIDCHREPTA
ncbi:5-formyltetrahydrofolate cyclo-ligase [Rhodanobacter umsongensis]|uniref:5-formyltetrahydrofolate cyclo-ligase n=1 Tax=Rhodanobacter umsongensis TaxID=633153 RepID=A0ABW0JMW1_9GAMM